MKLRSLSASVAATAMLAAGTVVMTAAPGQAFEGSVTLNCAHYADDGATPTAPFEYTDQITVAGGSANPRLSVALIYIEAANGPLNPSDSSAPIGRYDVSADFEVDGDSGTTQATAVTSYAFPLADTEPGQPLGTWSALANYIQASPGDVTVALQRLRFDDTSPANDDIYCSSGAADVDHKAAPVASTVATLSFTQGTKMNCRLYFGDVGTGTSPSVYVEALDLTSSPASPAVGAPVTLTASGVNGPKTGPVGIQAGSQRVEVTVSRSGAEPGQMQLVDDSYPTADVATYSAMGAWSASGLYTPTVSGQTSASIRLVKFNDTGSFNVDTYCAEEPDADHKATGGQDSLLSSTWNPETLGGTFARSSSAIWLTQLAGLTPSGVTSNVAKLDINWGDGKKTLNASRTAKSTHLYATAGTFPVSVVVTSTAGVAKTVQAGSIKVTKDAVKPVVTLTVPSSGSYKVASWKTLRGKMTDTGLGARYVYVKLIEKRGTAYYYYTGTKWVKASSKTSATTRTARLTITPASTGAWSKSIAGLTKGSLTITYYGIDKAGNVASPKAYTKALTA